MGARKMIEINDKDKLIRIFKTISWLDSKRWGEEKNYNFINFAYNDLTNSEKILTHWICYITDRQMPFEIVWDRGGYVFSELVHEYSSDRLSVQQILERHYENYQNGRYRFKSQNNDITFASRYISDDYQSIKQTLEVLNEYDRNIIRYIVSIMRRYENREDLLLRVACALHLLTYQLDNRQANPDRIINIINDDQEFENKLKYFKQTSTKAKKRLWCCIRDYKKGFYHRVFTHAIRDIANNNAEAEELIRLWNSLPMDQIELPGDVWNNSSVFRNNLFAEVIDMDRIPKTWGMPDIIRDLYEQLQGTEGIENFYPEQFDVTFDFIPRMCNKKLCEVCLFGKNGVEHICIPTEDKYCPVVLFSCGYIARCQQENCIIREGISKDICIECRKGSENR